MEPLRALTLVAVAGVVSLVGSGAAGFYAGYIAGRGGVSETRQTATGTPFATGPVAVAASPVSLKPVLEDIRALSRQVESLSAPRKSADDGSASLKPVLDEVRSLSRQIDGIKTAVQTGAGAARQTGGGDTSESLNALREQLKIITSKQDRPSASGDNTDALDAIRDQITALNARFDKQEPKAPKALLDEIKLLSATVQAQDPNVRRAVIDEIRNAVTTLQNTEPRVSKALLDEIRTLSASMKPAADSRSQSVSDQFKVLSASLESLKAKVPDSLADDLKRMGQQVQALSERSGPSGAADRSRSDPGLGADVAQLRQLVTAASGEFGKCQTQLASLATAATSTPAAQPGSSSVAVSQTPRQEASAVVFYDNVMLRKDQEKQYDEIGVRLSLQSIAPRQVRVAVNRQGFGLAFGERKVFRSQDVECEMNLMETNLSDGQARVSISCKR